MAADVKAAADALTQFQLQVLSTTHSWLHADTMEVQNIKTYNTIGKGGYNTLKKARQSSAKFQYLRDKGLLNKRK